MGAAYRSGKEELEERIRMKKMQKAEKMKRKEDQGEFDSLLSRLSALFVGFVCGEPTRFSACSIQF